MSGASIPVTRRQVLRALGLTAATVGVACGGLPKGMPSGAQVNDEVEYGKRTLPMGVRSRRVETNNDAALRILEAGFVLFGCLCVVFLLGFFVFVFSWCFLFLSF